MFYYKNCPISWEIAPWCEAIFAVKFVKHLYQYTEYNNKLVESPVPYGFQLLWISFRINTTNGLGQIHVEVHLGQTKR